MGPEKNIHRFPVGKRLSEMWKGRRGPGDGKYQEEELRSEKKN